MTASMHGEGEEWGTRSTYGDYEIVGAQEGNPRLLTQRSFGKMFQAVRRRGGVGDEATVEDATITVINPKLLDSEDTRSQFIREFNSLSKFKHPNLIHNIHSDVEEGEVYCVMELCQGGNLSQLVRRYGAIPEKAAARIGMQTAAGLHEIHARFHWVHRKIRPFNIVLAEKLEPELGLDQLGSRLEQQEGLCRIADFGLVDLMQKMREGQKRFEGSPMFASPEQICEQPVDARSDIYSLGMTLWYLVQGKGPLLDSDGMDLKEMRKAIDRHTSPEEYEPYLPRHLSREFRSILAKMVAKRPEHRFASAAELMGVLSQFLSTAAGEVSQEDEAAASVECNPQPIENTYEEVVKIGLSGGKHTSYSALQTSSGQRVRLTVVANLQGEELSPSEEALFQEIYKSVALSQQPSFPEALFPVIDVLRTEDMLGYVEQADMQVHVSLADVLRARAKSKRPMAFSEAICVLRPIAEALDFMLDHERDTVFLPCEEVWISGESAAAAKKNTGLLTKPVTEWIDFRVHFSMMRIQKAESDRDSEASAEQTISGSLQMSASELHPVSVFARLVYRILNGSEVAVAVRFTPNAYVPAVTLGHASNSLIRDILCQQAAPPTVTGVLKELCANEGIVWRSGTRASPSSSTATGTASRTTGSLSNAGARISDSEADKPVSLPPNLPLPEGEPVAGSPGKVRSPFNKEVFSVEPKDWKPGAELTCPWTHNRFLLPAKLPEWTPEGIMSGLSAGFVRSPFDEGMEMQVPPDLWQPDQLLRCASTGRSFRLPHKLAPLVGKVTPGRPGWVQSPFSSAGQEVSLINWRPGCRLACAQSGRPFVLPAKLEEWISGGASEPVPELSVAAESASKYENTAVIFMIAVVIVISGCVWFGLRQLRSHPQGEHQPAALQTQQTGKTEPSKEPVNAKTTAKAADHPGLKDYLEGLHFFNGSAGSEAIDYDRAIALFLEAANQQLPEAEARLAVIYYTGIGLPKDDAKANDWAGKALAHGLEAEAQAEDIHAEVELAGLYFFGVGVGQSDVKAAELCKRAADRGDPVAQTSLGVLYASGRGVSQSYTKAMELYQQSADQGNVVALYNQGLLYERGQQGVPQSYPKAAELYQKAADRGYIVARNSLGLLYERGQGVPQNYPKAVELYQKGVDQGNAVAQNNLGVLYGRGLGVPLNYSKAMELYQKAADQGNTVAQTNLGLLYERGHGVTQDYPKAVELFQKAADRGNVVAQINLGNLYKAGLGVPQNYPKAVEYYQKAASQGNALALTNLGWFYMSGNGVTPSYATAAEYFQKAADRGSTEAQYTLGNLYKTGQGVPQNYVKAAELYQKAAEHGHVEAMYYLGMLYGSGAQGVPQNYSKAAEFLQKAAGKGLAEAQNELGLLYESGRGVEKNADWARQLYQKAAAQGNLRAKFNLERIRRNFQ